MPHEILHVYHCLSSEDLQFSNHMLDMRFSGAEKFEEALVKLNEIKHRFKNQSLREARLKKFGSESDDRFVDFEENFGIKTLADYNFCLQFIE